MWAGMRVHPFNLTLRYGPMTLHMGTRWFDIRSRHHEVRNQFNVRHNTVYPKFLRFAFNKRI